MPTSKVRLGTAAGAALAVAAAVVVGVLVSGGSGADPAASPTPSTVSTSTSTTGPSTPTTRPTGSVGPVPSTSPAAGTARPTTGAPATTPVGPPSVAISTAAPVPVGRPAQILPGVVVRVDKVADVAVRSEQPGQVAGPAVAVTVTVRNDSGREFQLGGMVLNVSYGADDTPGPQTEASPSRVLTGVLVPKKSATGVYVFNVPKDRAASLRVQVSSDRSPTILEFAR